MAALRGALGCSLLVTVAAWSPGSPGRTTLSRSVVIARSQRCVSPACFSDDNLDTLVLSGDVGVLIAYGAVQSAVDGLLMPIATAQPDMFTQTMAVPGASLQGIVLAALWVGITLLLRGYRPSVTRSIPAPEALFPLACAWLGSGAILVLLSTLIGLPYEAELEFALGSATVVGGWRLLYSRWLPLP